EHDEGGDDLAAGLVGKPDHPALADVGVTEQRLLDLGPGDVIAGRDDHVVVASLEPEVAVGVLDEGVAGDVPPLLDVRPLPVVGQVTASGRALDGQSSGRAGRLRVALRVEDAGDVPGDGPARGSRPDVVVRGGDEDVQHLRGA